MISSNNTTWGCRKSTYTVWKRKTSFMANSVEPKIRWTFEKIIKNPIEFDERKEKINVGHCNRLLLKHNTHLDPGYKL